MNDQRKGLYVARLDLGAPNHSGVANKINAQKRAFDRHGFSCEVLSFHSGEIRLDDTVIQNKYTGPLAKKVFEYDFYIKFLDLARSASWVYLRYQRASPILNWCLQRLKASRPEVPIFVEFPTWPQDQLDKGLRGRVLSFLDIINRRKMSSFIDSAITFTKHKSILGVNTIRIQNGIEIQEYTPHVPPSGDIIRILGLANLSYWHGYDRIIEGLYRQKLQGGRGVHFEIAGVGAELQRLEALVHDRALQDVVFFHGHVQGEALRDLIGQCHFGVGAIGMHRIGVKYSSAIKLREYCARGLPFMFDHEDADFPPDFPYALRVSATDDPINISDVVGFLNRLAAERPRYTEEMAIYAETNLTWIKKLEPVVSALSQYKDGRSHP